MYGIIRVQSDKYIPVLRVSARFALNNMYWEEASH